MRKYLLILVVNFLAVMSYAQSKPAYLIFNAKGKKVSFQKMAKRIGKADILLFGEIHDNPIDHWLQLELVKELSSKRNLMLGAEMFETDNQVQLDNYLKGQIDDIESDTTLRLWPNYATDYAPLVEFAKANNLPFIATNVPAQFAKLVYRSGLKALESFDQTQLSCVAPQPMPFDSQLKTYQNILTMMEHHGTPELVMAQALRDATMAHFILKYFRPGNLFIHINGTYHSEYYEGILWYLKKQNDRLVYITIATVQQTSVEKLLEENQGKADFIICVDEDMTETH
ncbi:MAG: ChaN family lipoprotein [Saprospiraceae bacterium]|nr:ChaN family lipoprotein [Saprospiraceae bacterium]